MAKFLVFLFLIAAAVAVFSAPLEEEQVQMEEEHLRLPRATCDLLSGFGVSDSACAAHCLALGRKGGWCERGVCHCRR